MHFCVAKSTIKKWCIVATLALAFVSIFLLVGCGGRGITIINAKWEDGAYRVSVNNDIEIFDFTKEIFAKNGYSYLISDSSSGDNILLTQKAKLSIGENKFHVFVYNQSRFQNKYELIVFRKDTLVRKTYKANESMPDNIVVAALNKLQTAIESEYGNFKDFGAIFEYNNAARIVSITLPSIYSEEVFENIEKSKRITVRDDKNPTNVIVDFFDFEDNYVTYDSELGQYCVAMRLASNAREILQQYCENNSDAELYLYLDDDKYGYFPSEQVNDEIIALVEDYSEAKKIVDCINYYVPMMLMV